MASDLEISYEEVPYDTRPRPATHPDVLATLATLLGMQPAPVERCRVLELGCATGGNLLPMADALPDAELVGVDLSATQIEMGRRVAAAVGLTNLHLYARSILEVDSSLGQFDYVICHGVYSWVNEEVRNAIFRVCKQLLNPNGVAYISYNTYPGWYLRAPMRDLLNYHVRDVASPRERAAESRNFLQFFVRALPTQESTWARLVRQESETLLPEGDYYILHEHLDTENHAVYFHEFAEQARRHGLQYLGEASTHLTLASYPPEVQRTLQQISSDLLALEQYVDFLKGRTFRCTLLVHDDVHLKRSPSPEILDKFLLGGLARPTPPEIDVCTPEVVSFHNEDGASVETNLPVTKAALVTLYQLWPRAIRFGELWEQVGQRLAAGGVSVVEEMRPRLAAALVELYLARLVDLHTYIPAFVSVVSDRPATSALVRLQATSGADVYNRRQRKVELTGMDRAVLGMLDGGHDRDAVLRGLVAQVTQDHAGLRVGDRVVTEPAEVQALLAGELDESLRRLAGLALLVG